MNESLNPSEPLSSETSVLSLASVPLEELILLLSGLGIDLLRQVMAYDRLSLGKAVIRTTGAGEFLSRVDNFRPGPELPDGRLYSVQRTLVKAGRNFGVLNRLWMQLQALRQSSQVRRLLLQRRVEQMVRGRRSVVEFRGLFNGFLRQEFSQRSGCAIPASVWQTGALAAWTNPSFTKSATDVIHGALRSRVCRTNRWDRAPLLHPNTIWMLVRLASPSGFQPPRMLHVLRAHAERSLEEKHWARFWDQWVLAEAVQCRLWHIPRQVLALPYVLEQKTARQTVAANPDMVLEPASDQDAGLSELSHPEWNKDRPECLLSPWPPDVFYSQTDRHRSGTGTTLQRNLHDVLRK